jgi:site-specific recombinase XerD
LPTGAGGDFDNRYSQRGVQWAVKQVAKAAGIIKEVTPIPCDTLATHLLEDGMDIMTLKDLWDIKMLRLQWNTCILPNSRVTHF